MSTDGTRGDGIPARTLDGEPALFLVESLIHEFVARGLLDRRQAADIVAVALEVQISNCDDRNEDPMTSASVVALSRIQSSLAIDGQPYGTDGHAPGHDGHDPSRSPPRDGA